MLKVWKFRKFKTNTKQRRCPIRKFSRQATHDYPIHEKDGAVLVSLISPVRKARADKGGQNLPEIELCQKDQDEAQRKQKLSLHTIHVIRAQSTSQDVETGVNEENEQAKNDVHDTFLPKEKNQDLQNLSIPTDEITIASVEPEKKEIIDNPDACTQETRVSRPVVAKKSVKKGIFFRKTRGENQNGKKIAPVNQHQDEKRGKECWGDKYKDSSQTNNAVNKPVSNDAPDLSKKIVFWKRNKQNHTGKKVAPTEQKQGDKDGGHFFEGDSRLVKEGGEITTTTTPKLANVENGDAILVKEVEESTTTTAPMLVNLTNVPSSKSMEVISHSDNGTHIHSHYYFYGETHIHNHGLELHRNKTYTSSYSAPNGIISTGNMSKNTVNNNGRNTSQQTRRESF